MPKARVFPFTAVKDCGWTALARVLGPDGELIQQADLSSIVCDVENDAGTATLDATLTISAVIFDALQTDDRWQEDGTGFNFAYEVPASAFPAQGNYRIEFTFTPVSGEAFKVIFEGPAHSSFDA